MEASTQTCSPNSTPRAATKQRISPGAGTSRQMVVRIMAIAGCEIRLQWRSMAYWVMLAAFAVLTGIYAYSQVPTIYNHIDDTQAATAISSYTSGFVLFLLPFLFLGTFARDQQRKVSALLWTRPLTSTEYALGKGLAATLLSLLLSWPPLIVGWLVASIARGNMQPLDLWLGMLLISGAVTILVALFALLCIELTPLPLLGAIISAGAVLYLNIVLTRSMLMLTDLTAATLFASPSIGFGPDSSLVIWQRLSYLAGGLLCLGLLLLIYQARERLGVVRLQQWIGTSLLIVITGTLLFSSTSIFQTKVAQANDPGQVVDPVKADITRYSLEATADPASGLIHGTATFLITVAEPIGDTFSIGLNPGLHVQQFSAIEEATNSSQPLRFVERLGWTSINTGKAGIVPGHPARVRITYAGQMALGRDYYAAAAPGVASSTGIGTNYFYFGYLGQGMGALPGAAGSWFPLPWTHQALDTYGTRLPIETLRLRFPGSFQVLSALGTPVRTADGQWELNITPHGSLPVALAAILQAPRSIPVSGATLWYQGTAPDQAQLHAYTIAAQETQAFNRWLGNSKTGEKLNIVRVPLLQIPLLGPGMLFIPEKIISALGLPITDITVSRLTANYLADAWWLNATLIPFQPAIGEPTMQVPYQITAPLPQSYLLKMLSAYSAVVITDQIIGQDFLKREMSICQQIHDKPALLQNNLVQNQMLQMGLTGCIDSELALYKLQQQLGSTRLTSFLQQYASLHAQQRTDLRDFLKQAGVLVGHNIAPEAGPYICSGRVALQTGTPDPLACIDQNGVTGT